MTVRSSIRQWFDSKARAKTRRPRARPGLEVLEDRLVPAGPVYMIDVGGLHFSATDGFEQTGQEYKATSGSVAVSLTPTGKEEPLPLIQADLSDSDSEFIVDNNPGDPTF